jgi:hypothetical protein
MIFSQYFHVAGIANTIQYDDGLKSTEAEKKRLLSVRLVVDEVADNRVQGYHERAKIFDYPDRLIDEETSTGSIDKAKPGARINEIEIGLEIPVGEVFKVAIQCGATATDIYGAYVYELIT